MRFSNRLKSVGYENPRVFDISKKNRQNGLKPENIFKLSMISPAPEQIITDGTDPLDFSNSNWISLYNEFVSVIRKTASEHGALEVRTGMNIGADLLWTLAAISVRNEYDKANQPNKIKVVGFLPDMDYLQSVKNSDVMVGKQPYKNILSSLDDVIVFGDSKEDGLYQKRSEAMLLDSNDVVRVGDDSYTNGLVSDQGYTDSVNIVRDNGQVTTNVDLSNLGIAQNQTNNVSYAYLGARNMNDLPEYTFASGEANTRFDWRESNVDPASPVTVNEFMNAFISSFPNSTKQNTVRKMLQQNLSSNIEANDPGSNYPRRVDVLETVGDDGKVYRLSPSQMEVMSALLDGLNSAGVDYDVVLNSKDNSLNLKVNDNARTEITLLDLQHPENTGRVKVPSRVTGSVSLDHVIYPEQTPEGWDYFAIGTSTVDGKWKRANALIDNSSKNKYKAKYFRSTSYNGLQDISTNSQSKNNKIKVDFSSPEAKDHAYALSLMNYMSLPADIRIKMALAPSFKLLGLETRGTVSEKYLGNSLNAYATNPKEKKSGAFYGVLDLGVIRNKFNTDPVKMFGSVAGEKGNVWTTGSKTITNLDMRSAVSLRGDDVASSEVVSLNEHVLSKSEADQELAEVYRMARVNIFELLNSTQDLSGLDEFGQRYRDKYSQTLHKLDDIDLELNLKNEIAQTILRSQREVITGAFVVESNNSFYINEKPDYDKKRQDLEKLLNDNDLTDLQKNVILNDVYDGLYDITNELTGDGLLVGSENGEVNLSTIVNYTGGDSRGYGFDMANVAKQSSHADKITGTTDFDKNRLKERMLVFDEDSALNMAQLQALDDEPTSLVSRLKYFKQRMQEEGKVIDASSDDIPDDFTQEEWNTLRKYFAQGDLIREMSPNEFKRQTLKTAYDTLRAQGIEVNEDDVKIDKNGIIHYEGRRPLVTPYGHYRSSADDKAYNGPNQHIGPVYDRDENGNYVEPDYSPGHVKLLTISAGVGKDGENHFTTTGQWADYKRKLYDQLKADNFIKYQEVSGSIGQVIPQDFDATITVDTEKGLREFIPYSVARYNQFERTTDGRLDEDVIRREQNSVLKENNRLRIETYFKQVQREVRQNIVQQTLTSNLGDITNPEDNTRLNKLYKGAARTEEVPEAQRLHVFGDKEHGIEPHMEDFELFNTLKADKASNIKFLDSIRDSVNTINENQQMGRVIEEMMAIRASGDDADIAHVASVIGDIFFANGGESLSGLAKDKNLGLFSLIATRQGGALGQARALDKDAKIDERTGIVQPSYILDNDGNPILDENGEPLRKYSGCYAENIDLLNYIYKSPFDRVFVALEQINKHEWIDKPNVAVINGKLFNMEDAVIVSKDFADNHHVIKRNGERRSMMMHDKISDVGGDKGTVSLIIDPDMPLEQAKEQGIEELVLFFKAARDSGKPLDVLKVASSQLSRNNAALIASYSATTDENAETVKVPVIKYDDNGDIVYKRDEDGNFVYELDSDGNKKPLFAKGANATERAMSVEEAEIAEQAQIDEHGKIVRPLLARDEDGNILYARVPEMTEEVVDTGATIGQLTMWGTDQLGDQNTQLYNEEERTGKKGRRYSDMVANADLERGATEIVEYMRKARRGKEFDKYRAYLNSVGLTMSDNLGVKYFDYEDPVNGIPFSYEYSNDAKELIDHYLSSDKPVNEALANKLGVNPRSISGKYNEALRSLESAQDLFAYDEDGNVVGVNNGSMKDIQQVFYGLMYQSPFKAHKQGVDPREISIGDEFLKNLPDNGGLLQLPEGMTIDTGDGESFTDKLYVLPKSLRRNTQLLDDTTDFSDYNKSYQQIGLKIAMYNALKDKLVDHYNAQGITLTDQQLQALGEAITEVVGIRTDVNNLRRDLQNDKLGGITTRDMKRSFFHEEILSKVMPNSATAVMTANPNIPIDVIEVSPEIAEQLGMEVDWTSDSAPYAYYKGHVGDDNWNMIHVHRDPVWSANGSVGMRVIVNPDLTAVRMNPMTVSTMGGDFDGDNLGLIGMPDYKAQRALKNKLSVGANLLNPTTKDIKPSTLLNVGAEFVDMVYHTNTVFEITPSKSISLGNNNELVGDNAKAIELNVNDPLFAEIVVKNYAVHYPKAGIDVEKLLGDKDENGQYVGNGSLNTADLLDMYISDRLAQAYKTKGEKEALRIAEDVMDRVRNTKGRALEQAGVNYSNEETTFAKYKDLVDSGAKGSDGALQSLKDMFHNYTKEDIDNKIKEIQETKSPQAIKEYKAMMDDLMSQLALVQSATAIKAYMTGVPGKAQQNLVGALRHFGEEGLMVANHIGNALTEGNLKVKREPAKALLQSDIYLNGMNALLRGQLDVSSMTIGLVGDPNKLMGLGNDKMLCALRIADIRAKRNGVINNGTVYVYRDENGNSLKSSYKSFYDIKDDDLIIKYAKEIKPALEIPEITDDNKSEIADGFRKLMARACEPELTLPDASGKGRNLSLKEYEHYASNPELIDGEFIARSLDFLYNGGVDKQVDFKIPKNLLDKLGEYSMSKELADVIVKKDGSSYVKPADFVNSVRNGKATNLDTINKGGFSALVDSAENAKRDDAKNSMFNQDDKPLTIKESIDIRVNELIDKKNKVESLMAVTALDADNSTDTEREAIQSDRVLFAAKGYKTLYRKSPDKPFGAVQLIGLSDVIYASNDAQKLLLDNNIKPENGSEFTRSEIVHGILDGANGLDKTWENVLDTISKEQSYLKWCNKDGGNVLKRERAIQKELDSTKVNSARVALYQDFALTKEQAEKLQGKSVDDNYVLSEEQRDIVEQNKKLMETKKLDIPTLFSLFDKDRYVHAGKEDKLELAFASRTVSEVFDDTKHLGYEISSLRSDLNHELKVADNRLEKSGIYTNLSDNAKNLIKSNSFYVTAGLVSELNLSDQSIDKTVDNASRGFLGNDHIRATMLDKSDVFNSLMANDFDNMHKTLLVLVNDERFNSKLDVKGLTRDKYDQESMNRLVAKSYLSVVREAYNPTNEDDTLKNALKDVTNSVVSLQVPDALANEKADILIAKAFDTATKYNDIKQGSQLSDLYKKESNDLELDDFAKYQAKEAEQARIVSGNLVLKQEQEKLDKENVASASNEQYVDNGFSMEGLEDPGEPDYDMDQVAQQMYDQGVQAQQAYEQQEASMQGYVQNEPQMQQQNVQQNVDNEALVKGKRMLLDLFQKNSGNDVDYSKLTENYNFMASNLGYSSFDQNTIKKFHKKYLASLNIQQNAVSNNAPVYTSSSRNQSKAKQDAGLEL